MNSRIPLIVDHDLGSNPDDLWAFELVLGSRRAELLFTISGNKEPLRRARLARFVLDNLGAQQVPSFVGETTGVTDYFCGPLLPNEDRYQVSLSYLEAVRAALSRHNQVRYLAIQGCSNLKRIFEEIPESRERLDIVHLGLTTTDYALGTDGGTNMRCDPEAARFVYQHAFHLKAVGLQTTLRDDLRVTRESPLGRQIELSRGPLADFTRAHLAEFYDRRKVWPCLHDSVAAAEALDFRLLSYTTVPIVFLPNGSYRRAMQSEQGLRIETSLPTIDALQFQELQAQCSRNARAIRLSP